MEADDEEMQRQIEEAIQRSLEQTTLGEDDLVKEAIAESLRSQDEEVALRMQQEQFDQFEAQLSHKPEPESPPKGDWVKAVEMSRTSSSGNSAVKIQPSENLGGGGAARPHTAGRGQQEWQTVRSRAARDMSHSGLSSAHTGSSSAQGQSRRSPNSPHRAWGAQPIDSAIPRDQNGSRSPSSPHFRSAAPDSQYGYSRRSPRQAAQTSPRRRVRSNPTASSPLTHIPPAPLAQSASVPLPSREPRDTRKPVVVIDGQNVGCEYSGGDKGRFRARGVEIVLDYYRDKGLPAVALLPKRKIDGRSSSNPHLADDPNLLRKLSDEGRVSFTPAGAHDDFYILSYAMKVNADVISNDMFRKELDMQKTVQDARALRAFLDQHLIPYTFIAGEFIPNPNPAQIGRSMQQSRAEPSNVRFSRW